ncbi:hypothetical protein JCM16303_000979 [Sporobolomyces ruberrimus]
MHLLPFVSLFAIVSAFPSPSEPLVWSRVPTSKPTTSALVWSRVDTSKPSSTATTSTPVWTRVTRTRTSASSPSTSTTLSSTVSPSPSTSPCPPPTYTRDLDVCNQDEPLDWFKATTYLNYQESGYGFYNNSKATNGTGYYSGTPCPDVVLEGRIAILRIAASEELVALHGGFDQICGKKLLLKDKLAILPVQGMITRTCSSAFCPGVSFGMGNNDWYDGFEIPGYPNPWKGWFSFPGKFHTPVSANVSWVDWEVDWPGNKTQKLE